MLLCELGSYMRVFTVAFDRMSSPDSKHFSASLSYVSLIFHIPYSPFSILHSQFSLTQISVELPPNLLVHPGC